MSGMISVFSSIILLATVSTLALALFTYIAYKVRERRKPGHADGEDNASNEPFQPVFLTRHMLDEFAPPVSGNPAMPAGDQPTTQTPEEK